MAKKTKNNVLLLLSAIFSYIAIAISVFSIIVLSFNLFGVVDIYEQIMSEIYYQGFDVENQITVACIDLVFGIFMNLYFANFYLKGYKFKVYNKEYGKAVLVMGILQLLISSFIPAVLAIIAGGMMMSKKKKIVPEEASAKSLFSEYKMEAMAEAVGRLKELRARGAISEEEYYENLNKILEG